MISENTARLCGGTYMAIKFNEPAKTSPERDYKPGEVAERIKAKLR